MPGPGKPKTCADTPPQSFIGAGASAGPSSERGTHNRGKRADQRIPAGGSPVTAAGADQETSRAPVTAGHATVLPPAPAAGAHARNLAQQVATKSSPLPMTLACDCVLLQRHLTGYTNAATRPAIEVVRALTEGARWAAWPECEVVPDRRLSRPVIAPQRPSVRRAASSGSSFGEPSNRVRFKQRQIGRWRATVVTACARRTTADTSRRSDLRGARRGSHACH